MDARRDSLRSGDTRRDSGGGDSKKHMRLGDTLGEEARSTVGLKDRQPTPVGERDLKPLGAPGAVNPEASGL